MSKLVRIGSVPYLNSKALIWGLEEREKSGAYTLELQPPSLLAKRLAAGELDVALVSSVEFFRHDTYRIVPGIGVCGDREMWSIRLFHRGPLKKIRRVALDPASETTNTLVRVVLAERHGLNVEYVRLAPGEDGAKRGDLDGHVRIGDPCLTFREPGFEPLDLMAEWRAHTGLPFVFAAWLVRGGVELGPVKQRLAQARRDGLAHIDEIAKLHHEEVGLSLERARAYVGGIIHYDLGDAECAGLRRFGEELAKLGLIKQARELVFV
ncbi:MAG: menaquinone biosynthesis protein [Planctomycetes bacterium]|nr:menaquinone biosynthesis protein [Planctomycetota bacterium]